MVLIKPLVAHVVATDVTADVAAVTASVVAGLIFAQLLGGWFTQQSPAGISTGLVVAALTVIEPASAVGIGAAGLGRRSAVGLSVTPPAERDHLIRVSR